jgi:molybdate transport system substrate-binding protein
MGGSPGMIRRAFLLAVALSLPAAAATPRPEVARVAAAADLRFALDEAARRFEAETGRRVEIRYGSSGLLYQQIRNGAPFHLFLSADEALVLKLADAGLARDRGRLYAIGRIAIVAPRGSTLRVDPALAGLRSALAQGRLRRFAIASPDHAPYGQRAAEALRHAGLWDAAKPRLVFGENVGQALQFALSGAADGGLVAYSLLFAPGLADRANHALIPAEWHAPLRQRMVLLNGAGASGTAFYRWLQGPPARAILARYGFGLPGDR